MEEHRPMTRTHAPAKAAHSPAASPAQTGSRFSTPIQAKEAAISTETLLERSQLGQSFDQAEFPTESLQPATSGRPLPKFLREKMESAFDTDFSNVRVHEDGNAEQIGALAYTRGKNLHFAPGQFRPHSTEGQKIIGHELTHVVQQRSGHVFLPQGEDLPINSNSKLEREADIMSAKAVQGDLVQMKSIDKRLPQYAAINAPIQAMRLPWTPKPINYDKDDKDKLRQEKLGGGSANPVYAMRYANRIGESKSRKGYFKPAFAPSTNPVEPKYIPGPALPQGIEEDMQGGPRLSARAVASSRLDKHLGLNVLAEEQFASHVNPKGALEHGAVSAEAFDGEGVPLSKNYFETPSARDAAKESPSSHKKVKGKTKAENQYFKLTRNERLGVDWSDPANIDWKNPETSARMATTQKSFADLGLMDAITNQKDRHSGNIYLNPKTGLVKGIDNDLAFGQKVRDGDAALKPLTAEEYHSERRQNFGDRSVGLPSLIDVETAQRVLKLKGKDLDKILNDHQKNHEQLNPAEIEATKRRLKAVKNHIKQLQKDKKLVGQEGGAYEKGWNQDTFNDTINSPNMSHLKAHYDAVQKEKDKKKKQVVEAKSDVNEGKQEVDFPNNDFKQENKQEERFDPALEEAKFRSLQPSRSEHVGMEEGNQPEELSEASELKLAIAKSLETTMEGNESKPEELSPNQPSKKQVRFAAKNTFHKFKSNDPPSPTEALIRRTAALARSKDAFLAGSVTEDAAKRTKQASEEYRRSEAYKRELEQKRQN